MLLIRRSREIVEYLSIVFSAVLRSPYYELNFLGKTLVVKKKRGKKLFLNFLIAVKKKKPILLFLPIARRLLVAAQKATCSKDDHQTEFWAWTGKACFFSFRCAWSSFLISLCISHDLECGFGMWTRKSQEGNERPALLRFVKNCCRLDVFLS